MRLGGVGGDRVAALEATAQRLLRAGRPEAALRQAQKALAIRARTAPPSPEVVSTLVLVANCYGGAGQPVAAVDVHAQAVLRLAELVPYSGTGRDEPPSARIGLLVRYGFDAGLALPAFDAEGGRLRDRLRDFVSPFEAGGPAQARARFATLSRDEVAALPYMMINVNEAATTSFRRGHHELSAALSGGVATLGQLSQHLGDGYRRPCIRALLDLAGRYQFFRDYGEMWVWMRVAFTVAAVFVGDPDDVNLRLARDTLDLASKGLQSAGLPAQATRARTIAQQAIELTGTAGPRRVAMAALVGTHLAELVGEVDALLGG